jgi:predicted Ser/Thr protein kinase
MTPVPIGTRLGQYVIEPLLGEGGMGTVYRARDTRLNRPVAIKFLSDHLADDARRRFQREAQMASSLNHPHILTVHDAGEFEGRQYLVTELIDGGTLKDWAHSEKRTWNEIVGLLTGVADGLAAAHQAGILHRDVKPANILVARNGYAKLADFGLAKLEESRSSGDTRTLLDEPTLPGAVVGTIAYMSPEQASGRAVDARSDIFSFGVVLYELLAGRKPFTGASNLDVLQAIVRSAPEPLGPDIPLPLRMAVEKALEKDPAARYQSMRDLVVDLRRAGRAETAAATPSVTVGRAVRWRPWAMAAGLAASLAGVLWVMSRPEAAPENSLAGATFTRLTDFEGTETSPAISPDGKFVAFVSGRHGKPGQSHQGHGGRRARPASRHRFQRRRGRDLDRGYRGPEAAPAATGGRHAAQLSERDRGRSGVVTRWRPCRVSHVRGGRSHIHGRRHRRQRSPAAAGQPARRTPAFSGVVSRRPMDLLRARPARDPRDGPVAHSGRRGRTGTDDARQSGCRVPGAD